MKNTRSARLVSFRRRWILLAFVVGLLGLSAGAIAMYRNRQAAGVCAVIEALMKNPEWRGDLPVNVREWLITARGWSNDEVGLFAHLHTGINRPEGSVELSGVDELSVIHGIRDQEGLSRDERVGVWRRVVGLLDDGDVRGVRMALAEYERRVRGAR